MFNYLYKYTYKCMTYSYLNIICNTDNYKIWIHTIILVHIPLYTYNYMSNYTFIDIMR